ncbi:MAG: MFS transporter [Thermoanaerobaculia bacterium]
MSEVAATPAGKRWLWGLTGYQWGVLAAAWLGWGFDVFDGILFNWVAPNCVPTLLGIPIGSPEARKATLEWTGIITSVLLVGWATGGIVFGRIADRVGRTRTLLLTMTLYAVGTAACAFAPNLAVLMLFRFVAALGIGGEWAAGAAMVAEVMPEKRRVEAGALLYTAAPLGIFLAGAANYWIAGVWMKDHPETSWRWVFATGLVPALVAVVVRLFVREPELWKRVAEKAPPPRLAELFQGENRRRVRSGLFAAFVALVGWWSCNAFLPVVASNLASTEAAGRGLDRAATLHLVESWKATATQWFNWGGLVGTLATVPIAKRFGRRAMFGLYFLLSGVAIWATYGPALAPETRLMLQFGIGFTVFGVFGSFTYYMPELFPTRLRATGAGFCYNTGRYLAAAGPVLVGYVAGRGATREALLAVGAVPIVALLFLPWIVETRGKALEA